MLRARSARKGVATAVAREGMALAKKAQPMSTRRKGTVTDVTNVLSSGVGNESERNVQRQSTTQLVEQGTRSGVSVTGAVPNVDDREPLGEVNLIHQTHPISDFDIVSNVHVIPKDPQPVLKALLGMACPLKLGIR